MEKRKKRTEGNCEKNKRQGKLGKEGSQTKVKRKAPPLSARPVTNSVSIWVHPEASWRWWEEQIQWARSNVGRSGRVGCGVERRNPPNSPCYNPNWERGLPVRVVAPGIRSVPRKSSNSPCYNTNWETAVPVRVVAPGISLFFRNPGSGAPAAI